MKQRRCTGQPGDKNRAQGLPVPCANVCRGLQLRETDKGSEGKGSLQVGSPSLELAVSTSNSESKEHKSVHTDGLLQRLGRGLDLLSGSQELWDLSGDLIPWRT